MAQRPPPEAGVHIQGKKNFLKKSSTSPYLSDNIFHKHDVQSNSTANDAQIHSVTELRKTTKKTKQKTHFLFALEHTLHTSYLKIFTKRTRIAAKCSQNTAVHNVY